MKLTRIAIISLIMALLLITAYSIYQHNENERVVMLATTTSVENTGLLDMLINEFYKISDYEIRVIPRGTGVALGLAYDGEVDAILVHAPEQEQEFVDAGYGINHTTLWYNYFIIVGPQDDPANISQANSAVEAFSKIYDAGELGLVEFYSRGDNSGTHIKELSIWGNTSYSPNIDNDWYKETGTGMTATLQVSNENFAYTLSDLGTFTQVNAATDGFDLDLLYSGDEILFNPYSYALVSPEMYPDVNSEGAMEFLEFLILPSTIELVRNYQVYETVLFTPIDQLGD